MPRTSRSVAQRLDSQTNSKKRRPPRPGTPSPEASVPASSPSAPSIAEILDEVVPSEGGSRAESMASMAPASAPAAPAAPNRVPTAGRRAVSRPVGKLPPARRRYSEYAAEYAYVKADLHRILIVAGILIALLVALSFVLPH